MPSSNPITVIAGSSSTAVASSSRNYQDYDRLVRTCVLGDTGVGKSSLILRFSDDIYTESFLATIGLDFKARNITTSEGKTARIQLRDSHFNYRTSSHEIYIFTQDADAILVLFDTTDIVSFTRAKEIIEQIDGFGNNKKEVILVGTKVDSRAKRVIDFVDAKDFAEEKGIDYAEVSAKNATNVQRLFEHLAKKMLNPRPEPLPSSNADKLTQEKVELLKKRLRTYTDRVSSHKVERNIDFEAGFWFFAKSRAANREANYLLAKKLLAELEKGNTSKSLFTQNTLYQNRDTIIENNKIFRRDGYVKRDINSNELNDIISFANKP